MEKEKVMNENLFDEEAPQAPEFTLDEDNPLKWGDEVEQKLPEFETPNWEEVTPKEPQMGFEAEPHEEVKTGWEAEHNNQTGWNNGQANGPQYGQAQYGPNGQYGQQSPYGQPYGQPYSQQPYGQMGPVGEKNKLVAGLLAIFLGSLGIHKFYLGLNQQGIIMLVASLAGSLLCGLGPIAMGIIALIEGIMYLTQTDQAFYEIYEVGKKPWF